MEYLEKPITVRGYPIPPSDNALKRPVRRFVKGGKKRVLTFCDSHDYSTFKNDLNIWWLQYHKFYSQDFLTILAWVRAGHVLGIECDMRVHHEHIYTTSKKAAHRLQRLDPANRLKALHDTLSKLIGIDDTVFFETWIRKVEIPKTKKPCFYLRIGPIEPGKDFPSEESARSENQG